MKKHRRTVRFFPLAFMLGLTIILCQVVAGAPGMAGASPPAAPAAPAATPDWTVPITITTAATAPFGASVPVVKAAPDGKTVMVVFNRHKSIVEGDNDPYYSRSLDNGETWSNPAAIQATAANSRQVHLDYDTNGVAHVVWQENKGLAYANEGSANGGNWTNPFQELVAAGGNPGVTTPFIAASGSNRLDVVWSEGAGGLDPNIYHARSKDGGSTWPITGTVQNTGWFSKFPKMIVETQTGIIHLVWQENDDFFNPNHGTVKYTQGTESGGSISWSSPIDISTADAADAREPAITLMGGALHVVYTDFGSATEQYVRHVQCASQCTNSNNWLSTSSAISGQKMGANGTDPLNVVAALAHRSSCAIVYFHGTSPDLVDNEIVWGLNSCAGWSASPRDQVTSSNIRTINPSLDVQSNWWLYLAYEQGNSNEQQIYLHRGKPDVYLPVAFK